MAVAVESWAVEEARRIVLQALGRHPARVWLFGSRATGTAKPFSDLDIAVESDDPFPRGLLAEVRAALDDSTIPFEVDLVDLAEASEQLRARVHREGIRWNG